MRTHGVGIEVVPRMAARSSCSTPTTQMPSPFQPLELMGQIDDLHDRQMLDGSSG